MKENNEDIYVLWYKEKKVLLSKKFCDTFKIPNNYVIITDDEYTDIMDVYVGYNSEITLIHKN